MQNFHKCQGAGCLAFNAALQCRIAPICLRNTCSVLQVVAGVVLLKEEVVEQVVSCTSALTQ
jgi:hypothetical protein